MHSVFKSWGIQQQVTCLKQWHKCICRYLDNETYCLDQKFVTVIFETW
jgi:hypothetical protein